MKFGKLRSDGDCTDYVIPEDRLEEFDLLMEQMDAVDDMDSDHYYQLCEVLTERFGKFVVDGELSDMRIVIEE